MRADSVRDVASVLTGALILAGALIIAMSQRPCDECARRKAEAPTWVGTGAR